MKILYIITQYGVGGAEKVVTNLAHEMNKLGHEVLIVSLLDMRGLDSENIDVIYLNFKRSFVKSFFQLRKIILDFKPEVVHSHCLHANVITRLTRLTTKIPRLICSAHSSNEGDGIFLNLYKLTNKLADVNTNVSEAATKKFIENSLIEKKHIITKYNIIDLEKYDFNQEARSVYRRQFNVENSLVVVSVGSFKDAKDYPNLIEALSILKFQEKIEFKYFIVGDGVLYKDIEVMIKEKGLEDFVFLLGQRADIQAILSMADIFVLSSKFEGLPTVLIEAIMAENIVVSTNCEGVKEIIENDFFISKIGDSQDLCNKIFEAINFHRSNDLSDFIVNNKKYIKNKFSKEIVLKEWLDVYDA